ncbi:type II toxin-antitoxin system PemK/MazF family toxin [bacterium]|nr:type II toxin-antitoxin system PemK/MazF family toxin [bacterium]
MKEEELFDQWNEKKKILQERAVNYNFKERQVWWCKIGKNLGSEEYGKGENFIRPVLVVKKFNKKFFLGIPLSTKIHTGSWYRVFNFQKREIVALLAQTRAFSVKRLDHILGEVTNNDYQTIVNSLINLIKFDPHQKTDRGDG